MAVRSVKRVVVLTEFQEYSRKKSQEFVPEEEAKWGGGGKINASFLVVFFLL